MFKDWRGTALFMAAVMGIIMLLTLPAHSEETVDSRLIPVVTYTVQNEQIFVEKYIDSDLTKCNEDTCETVDVSIISDGPKGLEPGKKRNLVVTIMKINTKTESIFLVASSSSQFIDGRPKLTSVLGSREHPISNGWRLIPPNTPMQYVLRSLQRRDHEKKFE